MKRASFTVSSACLAMVCCVAATRAGAGSALYFDGAAGNVVRVPIPAISPLRLARSFTLEAWIRLHRVPGYNTDLVGFDDGWRLMIGGHTPKLYFGKAGTFGSLKVGAWTHVAISCDAQDTVRFFIDAQPASKPSWHADSSLRVGRRGGFFIGSLTHGPEPRYQAQCDIDEVRLWNVCLPSEALAAVHRRVLAGSTPGLVACWSFEEGAGPSAASSVAGAPPGKLGSMGPGNHFDTKHLPRWITPGAPLERVPAGGCISVAANRMSFGPHELTRGPGEPQALSIRNGSDDVLVVFAVVVDGPDARAFRIVGGSGGMEVAPRSSAAIEVSFAPVTAGSKSASLVVMSTDARKGIVTLALSGVARCRRPPRAPDGPDPADRSAGMKYWMYMSWKPAPGADEYDVYMWPQAGRRPTSPLATVTEAKYVPREYLRPGAAYTWQVVSRNHIGATRGPLWHFATGDGSAVEAPPFDISPAAREKRERLYRVPGRARLSGLGSPLDSGMRIAFFGDSITMQGGYIRNIEKALRDGEGTRGKDVKIFQHGLNGGRVPTVLEGVTPWGRLDGTMQELLDRDRPHVVSIWLGVNDVWHGPKGTTPKDFEAGLVKMVAMCRAVGARVVLSPVAILKEHAGRWKPKCDEYADITRAVAARTGATLVDLRRAVRAYMQNEGTELEPDGTLSFREKLLTYDGVHANAKGCELFADLIAQGIYEALRR